MTEQQMDLVLNLATWGSMSQQERDALLAMIDVVGSPQPESEAS